MISIEVTNGREVSLFLDKENKKVVERASRGVEKAIYLLANYIKEDLLSGQVLHNRTGNLRRSITPKMEGPLHGRVFIGEEGWYGKLHELGVHHSWVIEAKAGRALHFVIDGKDVFVKRVTVKGLPERSFMRRGLQEMTEKIVETIQAEVKK